MQKDTLAASTGLATLVFLIPAFVLTANAEPHRGGGGGGGGGAPHISAPAPHVSAPAPHISAPAPHFSAPAPRFSAPAAHFSPPAQRFAAPHVATPHFAAPHVATHFAAPHATPHFAAPHGAPHMARPHVTPHAAPSFAHGRGHPSAPSIAHGRGQPSAPSFAHRNTGRLAAHPSLERGGNRHALGPTNAPHTGAAIANAPNHVRGNDHLHGNAPTTVGQGPAGHGRNAIGNLQGAHQNSRGSRVLSNPVLANRSPRNASGRSLAQSTFHGRFAQSRWGQNFDRDRRHHHYGIVLGFVGPLFWPYAYDDFIDYTFWPTAYDTFWPYAYDDVFEGIYGGYAPGYDASYYAYAGAPGSSGRVHGRIAARGAEGGGGGGSLICSGNAQGLTDFPIQQIAQQVQPNQDQQALLDNLKTATDKAVQILQAACPTDLPATPVGRLGAMRGRVEAMLQAVQVVRPALDKFYGSLNDEQKERFNALDEESTASTNASGGQGRQGQQDLSQLCNSRKSPVAGLPVDLIRSSLHLSDAQNAKLQQLTDESSRAAELLNANCPTGQPLTPPGRLAAMEQRLQAMLQAIDTVRPALAQFYGSLSDEQKARFDRLGVRPA